VRATRIGERGLQLFGAMVVAQLLLLLTSEPWIDAAAAIPLVLVIPGLAILGSLEADRPRLAIGDAFVWSVVISFGSAVAGGLLLNLLGGLTRRNWLIYTAIVVTCATFVTIRTPSVTADNAISGGSIKGATVPHRGKGSVRRVNVSMRNLGTATIGLIVLGASFALSYQSADSMRERFTQLWLTPISQSSATSRPDTSYPEAQIGVHNHEGTEERYAVALFKGAGTTAAATWSIALGDGATWSKSLPRPPGTSLRVTLTYESGRQQQVQYVTLESSS